MAENWKKSVPRTAYESISASWALRSPGLTRGHPIEKAGSSKPLRSGIRRALLLVTHAGDALHVPRGRGLARLVQGADGPGHVVLDLRRVSRDVRRLLRGDGAARRRGNPANVRSRRHDYLQPARPP